MRFNVAAFYVLVSMMVLPAIAANGEVDTSDRALLVYALDSEAAMDAIQNESIKDLRLTKKNKRTTWSYRIDISTSEAGLSPVDGGPATHPCVHEITFQTIGGVAGTILTDPKVKTVCAANTPKFPLQELQE